MKRPRGVFFVWVTPTGPACGPASKATVPVDVVEARADHALAGGGVDELTCPGVDPDVVLLPAGLEEDQVPVLETVSVHRAAEARLGFRGAGRVKPSTWL